METNTNIEALESKLMGRIKGWQASQEGQRSAYEYERSFAEMMHHLGQDILQASVGEEPDSRKKKS